VYYDETSTTGNNKPNGVLISGTPTKPYQVANKVYVDNAMYTAYAQGAIYHTTVLAFVTDVPSDNPLTTYNFGYSHDGTIPENFILPISSIQMIDQNKNVIYPNSATYVLEFSVMDVDSEDYYYSGDWDLSDANDNIVASGTWEGAKFFEDQPYNLMFEEFYMAINQDSYYSAIIFQLQNQPRMTGDNNWGTVIDDALYRN
jgi:hypothetical protein